MNALITLSSSSPLIACASCMNDKAGTVQKAANLGIFMMLGVLVLIFSCLAVTAYNFARRSRRVQPTPNPSQG